MNVGRKVGNPSVFLSYAVQDEPEARRLEQALALTGIDIWTDKMLRAGDQWARVISEALENADVILVLISPSSLASKWVAREWQIALARFKRVIPVLVNGATYADLPPALATIQGIRFNGDDPAVIRELATAIQSLSSSTEPLPVQELNVQEIIEDTLSRTLERLGIDTRNPPLAVKMEENYVFVMISFDPSMEPTFAAIESAARRVGMTAERSKELKRDFRVTETILEKIESARLVVVDLTLERPNVYFELGYARGKGKTVVTLLKEGSKAHVDVRGWNYLEYIDSRPLEEDLVERFKVELQQP
ncbi:toll/interleukin-1 receptor domain-containing protein [Streptomyces cyaneofuscatus]|uniref:toll/interleukin-1 receptor domain-containing protein n=1 Tax=Streptomyces cyaneofuscatus TaxID=66883 RepID=UPI0033A14BAB